MSDRMNFRPRHRRFEILWGDVFLFVSMAVVLLTLLTMFVGCSTSTTKPDGTVVKDPPAVAAQKNLKFWRSELSVAQGVIDGAVTSGRLSPALASRMNTWLDTARTLLGVAADGTDSYGCLKDLSCSDDQLDKINRGIGQAIVLVLDVINSVQKK